MKKKIIIAGATVMLCLLGGCLQETPLTDGEMDVVAEYAADLLLKYDANNVSDNVFYYEDEMEVLVNPTSTPTPTPEPTPTPLPGQETVSGTAGGISPETKPTVTPIPENSEETNHQLASVLGAQEGIRMEYKEYEVTDTLIINDYSSLSAKTGSQFVVIRVVMHNDTEQEQVFDVSTAKIEYTLDINLGTMYKSALSMLENGIQYQPIVIPASGAAEAVLIFETDDAEINTAHLIIQNEKDETVFVKLK